MVVVTVGNATQGFKRLLEAVEQAAQSGLFGDESLFFQTGNTTGFKSSCGPAEDFIEMNRFQQLLREATLVVSHAGAGTILQVLGAGKIPIVMPRQRRYFEHVDDHQLELVEAMANEHRVIPVFEAEDLPDAVLEARNRNAAEPRVNSSALVGMVRTAIEQFANEKGSD